ncbi:dUTP diphosphatase [Paenibacillus sp.]|uniref:dUTP diphosphatase n=1 Tax=Paenibacillus sp. TaxID=58172 RepID=UPI002D743B69|nr:dUTP diphosphatase [Paenibacillus sp.]HZG83852.1 dUTP diphosphatase [Paenibacillus sp.]
MEITELYEMQKALDARIIEEKGLQGQDLLPNTVLALQVEIAELANEWRGFKHWSNDKAPRIEKMLEEYVDCLHFFLSIARQLGVPLYQLDINHQEIKEDTIKIFIDIITAVGLIDYVDYSNLDDNAFWDALDQFIALGTQRLGFTWKQIEAAYLAKNAVNHDRQATGY